MKDKSKVLKTYGYMFDKLQFIGLTRMNINYFINFFSLMFILVRPTNCSLSVLIYFRRYISQ